VPIHSTVHSGIVRISHVAEAEGEKNKNIELCKLTINHVINHY